jgi:endonuclease YncB( thermonuclease family)
MYYARSREPGWGARGLEMRLLTYAITLAAAMTFAAAPVAGAATRYVASGGTGSACSQQAPCGSFEAGYRSASPGDVVQIAAGSYHDEKLPDLGRSGPPITLEGPGRARVSDLVINADHLRIHGVDSTGWVDIQPAGSNPVQDVALFSVTAHNHWLSGVRDFLWKGGALGPSHDAKISMIGGGTPTSANITYDDITWHDATRSAASVHTECLLALGIDGLTIRNSRFRNCAVFDILISRIADSDPAPRNILIENTVFEASKDVGSAPAYYTFMTGAVHFDGFVVRNNVWEQPPALQGSYSRARMSGNIGLASTCQSDITYSHNVFVDHKCGPSDVSARGAMSQFANRRAHDWHLEPGATAINRGDPGSFPATDADGLQRPAGGAPDAGPFEFGATRSSGAQGGGAKHKRAGVRVRALRVIDGRTIKVRIRGHKARVRLAGVKLKRSGCLPHRAAAKRLHRLAFRGGHGRFMRFRRDPRIASPDRAGRLRGYLSVGRKDLGKALVAAGFAVRRPGGSFARRPAYRHAQRIARARDRGAWRGCG